MNHKLQVSLRKTFNLWQFISSDNAAYEELTKVISIYRFNLIDIIKDYQISANQAVNIFKAKYKVNDILEGWHNKVYEQTGKLIDEIPRRLKRNLMN